MLPPFLITGVCVPRRAAPKLFKSCREFHQFPAMLTANDFSIKVLDDSTGPFNSDLITVNGKTERRTERVWEENTRSHYHTGDVCMNSL